MRTLRWTTGTSLVLACCLGGCSGDDDPASATTPNVEADGGLEASTDAATDSSTDASVADQQAPDDVSTDTSLEDVSESDGPVEAAGDASDDVSHEGGGPGSCGDNQAWNPYLPTPACVDCSRPCNLPGETGHPHPTTALNGACVCETLPGYYFSLSGAGLASPCDEDGDGWVSLSARPNILSPDPAIAATAKCDLRTIDRVVLVSEGGSASTGTTILLADTDLGVTSLDLYEENKRDNQGLLDDDNNAPAYGQTALRASEVNSLTKICVSAVGDYNANGVPDIEEHDTHAVSTQPGWQPDVTSLFQAYARFGYFVELHRGWYENGAYYIQEKQRGPSAGIDWKLPITYAGDATFWNQCDRRTDSAFDPDAPAIGMDFARYNGAPHDATMFHHSQFKCVQVVAADQASEPHQVPISEIDQFDFNRCSVSAAGTPVQGTNPSQPILSCESVSAAQGDVGFAAVRYVDYNASGEYVRGCVNQCVESPVLCDPDYDGTIGLETVCDGDVNNFGKILCLNSVFVDGVNGDDANGQGTPSSPWKSIQKAITWAYSNSRDSVIVAAGTYSEALVLKNGVSVRGGFRPEQGWVRPVDWSSEDTVIEPPPVAAAYRHLVGVSGTEIVTSTQLEGVKIKVGGAGVLPGQTNYGMLAINAAGLMIHEVTIEVADGGHGADGTPGTSGTSGGSVGGSGRSMSGTTEYGFSCYDCACLNHPAEPFAGGEGGADANCPGGTVATAGGRGGGWRPGTDICSLLGESSEDPLIVLGQPGSNGLGAEAPWGLGGRTQEVVTFEVKHQSGRHILTVGMAEGFTAGAANGAPGAPGAAGTAGLAGSSVPAFHLETGLFVLGDGAVGADGTPGRGGGGGGGGTVVATDRNTNVTTGAYLSVWSFGTGGGGGTGGCPGRGGTGGRGGGGSFGMLLHGSSPIIHSVAITVGNGGNGGDGGLGGSGAVGKEGGQGGPNYLATFFDINLPELTVGGNGGKGGDGGSGGPGGGGAGGPAYCLYKATSGAPVPVVTGLTCTVGQGGTGGEAAPGGNAGPEGPSGRDNWTSPKNLAPANP